MTNLNHIIKESFTQYSGAVLQSRALVDVRDCLKPAARQIFYCMYTDKFTYNKPFKKTLKAIGSAMRVYIHGDSSCEGVIMRSGQPFSMRYPLVEVEGSFGNLMESGNWAAPRYTSSRLSELSNALFEDIVKDTITEWRDNYDDTEQYPSVLTSKGFYNIVNGTFGIGIGMGSSIPAFNLTEVNNALIKLLWNSDIDFNEIYCEPDFSTGAIILNGAEVKESLKNGNGKACKIRSVIEYNEKDRVLIVKEIPYGVYTNTICGELEEIINGDDNPGIERFNDLTAANPNIKIYLSKNANLNKVLKFLYKNTSLQYHYGINLTMLENGRFPKVFTWKEALQAHLNHEKEVYTKGFQFDLKKIAARLHILHALLKAYDVIDEVIAIIKSASNTTSANQELQKFLEIDEVQAKAILDLKLAKLSKLDVNKLREEQSSLEIERARIENILNNEDLLKKEIEKGLREVAEKFGDARRTKVMDISSAEDEEDIEQKLLQISLTNKNSLFINESSSLYTQKRGGVGNKIKLDKDEYIISTISIDNVDSIMFFTQAGNYYSLPVNDISIDQKVYLSSILPLEEGEKIIAISSCDKEKKYIIFTTEQGYIKKSEAAEYKTKRKVKTKAISLLENDKIVSVNFTNSEKIGILTMLGNFLYIDTTKINAIGRISRGVRGIKLNEGDKVSSARCIPNNTSSLVFISQKGYIKKVDINEFSIQNRDTKGKKCQSVKDDDINIDFIPIAAQDTEIFVGATESCIKISLEEVPRLSLGAQGNKSIKLKENQKVIGLERI